jgi:RNA polymerase sigma-70 factor (ECF subfamily)
VKVPEPVSTQSATTDFNKTRATLLEQIRSSDGASQKLAWGEFTARYAPVIAEFARRCGAQPNDCDDIIQDVMTHFVMADDFVYDPAKGQFRGWLKVCTVRAAQRVKQKGLNLRGVSLENVPELELAVTPMWNDIWEQELVNQAMIRLRSTYVGTPALAAFEMYGLGDQPASEVAEKLGISVESVYQHKTRMTHELRDLVRQIRDAD